MQTAAGRPKSFGANKIINGDFRIDQRNAGALVNAAVGIWAADRWVIDNTIPAKFSTQTRVPGGFPNATFLQLKPLAAYVPGAAESFGLRYAIEGLDCVELLWGTANAKPITISVSAFSTLGGSLGGAVRNGAADRSYTFILNFAANGWQTASITIPGDQAGVWRNDNGVGLYLNLQLGAGATVSKAPGAWGAGNFVSANGATNFLNSFPSEFDISQVKVEIGGTATPFVPDNFADSLAKCQRYYRQLGTGLSTRTFAAGQAYAVTNAAFPFVFSPTMRATPTFNSSGNLANSLAAGTPQPATLAGANFTPDGGRVDTISAGLVAGNASYLSANGDATAKLIWDAEL